MLLGIIFFIVGIVVFFEPSGTYLALSVLFGNVVILSGAFELYLGTKAHTGSGMGWYIAGGVIESLLGILLLCTPSMLFTILPFVLGFWLLFRGFMAVGVADVDKRQIRQTVRVYNKLYPYKLSYSGICRIIRNPKYKGEIYRRGKLYGQIPVSYTHLDVYKRQICSNVTVSTKRVKSVLPNISR